MKTALVTGGSRGIGEAISKELGKAYKVFVGYNSSSEKAEQVVKKIVDSGGNAEAIEINISNNDSVLKAFEKLESNGSSII